jgi:hypothetical protein
MPSPLPDGVSQDVMDLAASTLNMLDVPDGLDSLGDSAPGPLEPAVALPRVHQFLDPNTTIGTDERSATSHEETDNAASSWQAFHQQEQPH